MHICFLNLPIEYYSPVSGGAISTIVMETSRCLIEAGHQVTILSPATRDEQYAVGQVIPLAAKVRDDLSFPQRRLAAVERRLRAWDWPYYGYYLRSFQKALRAMKPAPDVVITFNDLVSAKYLRRILPRARICSWLQNEWRTCQSRRQLEESVAATDLFLTCSGYIRDWTARTHQIAPEKFAVLHSGIDPARFFPREDFLTPGSPASPLRVLFIGRIDPNKGPDLALEAVGKLRSEGLRVSMTIAGGLWFYSRGNEMADPYFRSLMEKMETLSATDPAGAAELQYLGHVPRPQVPELIRGHDVACVLSRSNEPFGLVVLEAMASGCAVIASNRGGLPEACGDAGILLNPDRFDDIVAALRKLATDPRHLAAMKRKSREHAAAAPWSSVAARLVGILQGTRTPVITAAAPEPALST